MTVLGSDGPMASGVASGLSSPATAVPATKQEGDK